MKYRAALAVPALLLIACADRMPTEPTRALSTDSPQFQVGQDQVNVSLSRNAEWIGESQIIVSGSFTCPESQTAFFQVQVTQAKPNGQVVTGFGSSNEACRFGSNKWSVVVFGPFFPGWDKGPAVAVVTMFSAGVDSDNGQINIR